MPATHTFATLCARLNRSPLYVRGLQRRFGLPIPAAAPTAARPPNHPTAKPSTDPTVPPSNRPTKCKLRAYPTRTPTRKPYLKRHTYTTRLLVP
jgi:hypothetical protein